MKRAIRIGLLAFAALWVAAVIGALIRRSRPVTLNDPADDEVALSAIFAPMAFRSTAHQFRGGTLDCWFGGGTLDLRDATLDPGGATIVARAIFGGGQIAVPAAWRVRLLARGLGGVTRTDEAGLEHGDGDASGPTLTVDATVLFGGFSVTSDLGPDAEHWLSEMLRRQDGGAPARS
jgi:hypothetical protein